MPPERLKGAEPHSADERTPIVGQARSSSYRATDVAAEPQSSADQPAATNAANPRQRRKADATTSVTNPSQRTQDPDHQRESWFRRTLDKYGAVELDNKGSTARDHLALERTFLAWLRTSLSFAGIGIAVTQLFRLNVTIQDGEGSQPAPDNPTFALRKVGKPLGATFLAISVIVLLIGWRRYFEAQFFIIKGKFPASRGSIFLTTICCFTLIVATFVIVLVVDPSLYQAK